VSSGAGDAPRELRILALCGGGYLGLYSAAVLAACAAPAYFASADIGRSQYADGGLFAVAPDQVALHEAEHFNLRLDAHWPADAELGIDIATPEAAKTLTDLAAQTLREVDRKRLKAFL
jgi:predicted acylesterase/phospholipase RssA